MNKEIFFTAAIMSGLLFGAVILPGCSTQPTLGERMMNQGSGTAGIGEQWSAGNEKVQKGEKLTKQGQELSEDARKDLREGEDKIIEGQKLITEGKKQMEESEGLYKKRFPGNYQRIFQAP